MGITLNSTCVIINVLSVQALMAESSARGDPSGGGEYQCMMMRTSAQTVPMVPNVGMVLQPKAVLSPPLIA
jgi:hypothetical protein